MTEQQKYRTFTFTATESGETFAYKETHEGLMCRQEDGTWTSSWIFNDIDKVARVVQEDTMEEWVWAWG